MNIVRVAALAVVLAIVGCGDSFWIRVVTGEDGVVTCLDPRIGNICTAAPYDAALEDLRHLARGHPCNWEYPYVVAGKCGDGETLFVEVVEYTLGTDLSMREKVTYYDAVSLRAEGFRREGTDLFPCLVARFWPRRIECPEQCFTEFINYCEEECLESGLGDLEDEPDYDTMLARWRAESPSGPEEEDWLARVAGSCGDGGTVFLHSHTPLGGSTTFYDAETGEAVGFVGLSYDFRPPPCFGTAYWPAKIECQDQVVTEVISGTALEVGDRLGRVCD